MNIKIATIVGARPQFIKLAPVSRAFRGHADVREVLVHTGQHYDNNMSDVFFEELEIPRPDYHLSIGSASHGAQTGRMLEAVERVLIKEKPDRVLVYGDTNSTLAGALAAVKLHIPVAHVEAGLRSFNRRMPEEFNRVLTDHASDLLFAPTQTAVDNLRKEGFLDNQVQLVGDVMYDAALYYGAKVDRSRSGLQRLGLTSKEYILATIHRPENTDDASRLEAVLDGLAEVGAEIPVLLPLHPRTRCAAERLGLLQRLAGRIQVTEPVGYLDMIMLEKEARLIVTDSGGVQKEAFFFRVPSVTLREQTEWVELLDLGWTRVVVPDNSAAVSSAIRASLDRKGREGHPFGDGQTAQAIVRRLLA